MIIQRRSFLTGLFSSLAAPAIVRASSLMPVKAVWTPPVVRCSIPAPTWRGYNERFPWTVYDDPLPLPPFAQNGEPLTLDLGTLEDYSRVPMTIETFAKRYAATLDDFAADSELFGADDFDGLAAR